MSAQLSIAPSRVSATTPRKQSCCGSFRGTTHHRERLLSGACCSTSSAIAAALPALCSLAAAAAAAEPTYVTPVDPAHYVPGPVDVGWQIYVGSAVATIPFIIGSYEFGKRILIQRRCRVCGGSGLVKRGKYLRKCAECGGFFPWLGWKMFWTSTAAPGNGGPLLAPRGQKSVFYTVPPKPEPAELSSAQERVVQPAARAEPDQPKHDEAPSDARKG